MGSHEAISNLILGKIFSDLIPERSLKIYLAVPMSSKKTQSKLVDIINVERKIQTKILVSFELS